jgi:predicted permease
MDSGWGTDLRYVFRVLGRSPGFVVVAVVSLAVGIGANAAMFSMVRSLLMEPLPVDAPKELALVAWRRDVDVDIWQNNSTSYPDPEGGGRYRSNFSSGIYESLRAGAPTGVRLFAFSFRRGLSVGLMDAPPLVAGGLLADGSYSSTLRVEMALGRPLTEADNQPDAPLVAVLSHAFWMRAFGGDPAIVGRAVRVNGLPAEVVGVTAKGFRGMSRGGFFPQTEVTVPLAAQQRVDDPAGTRGDTPHAEDDQMFWVRVMARIPDGVSWTSVEQTLRGAFVAQVSPANTPQGPPAEVGLLPGDRGAQPVGGSRARHLWILFAVVGVVLLIACVNLATLMLARGVARQREMAVRKALGGGRIRLVRQTVLESLVLAGAGTMAGLVLALVTRHVLSYMVSSSMGSGFGTIVVEGAVDPAVVALAALLGVGATVLFGLLPALRLSDVDPMTWLKHRAAGSTPRLTAGRLLLAMQIAVSVPLVVGAALFLRTLSNLGSVDLGFDPRGMVMFQIDPAYTQRPEEEHSRLYQEILAGVSRVPGVTSSTLMENAFLTGITSNSRIDVNGVEHRLYMNAIGPDFLETTGMRLLAGRMPGIQDGPGSPRVGVVNEKAVAELFGGASPVGQMLNLGSREIQVVGVINDGRYAELRGEVQPTLYPSALQRSGYGGHHIVLRTAAPLSRLEADIKQAIVQADSDLPVPMIQSQTAQLAEASARERLFTQLLTLFGGFALLLASIGLHGVAAYTVTRRTGEFGVRVALGARPGQLQWLVLRQVLVLAGLGLLAGVPASLAAGPVVGSLLYDVAPNDALTIVLASTVMVAVALAAGYWPARRAATMDALDALREE